MCLRLPACCPADNMRVLNDLIIPVDCVQTWSSVGCDKCGPQERYSEDKVNYYLPLHTVGLPEEER